MKEGNIGEEEGLLMPSFWNDENIKLIVLMASQLVNILKMLTTLNE